jgi:hypothetical protein
VKYKLQDLQQDVERLAFQLENGCGNHGCVIKSPTGMAPNGGCKCTPRQIKTKLVNLTAVIDRMNNKGALWDK